MVLEEDDRRLCAVGCLVGLDPVIDLLEEGVTRIGIFDVEGLREEFLAESLGILRTHQTVDKGRMGVDDIRGAHRVVEGSLH